MPSVLAVERLEVVEPDGSPALILANSQRPAAATLDDQVVMAGQEEDRKGVPSILFFDGKGDEVGGMLFGSVETSEGFRAVRHLSLDAHNQDQAVVLAHYQDPGGSRSGLTISDRPAHSLLEAQVALGLIPGASREELNRAVAALPAEERAQRMRELFGTARAFFGVGRDGSSALTLLDGEGRPRWVLDAPRQGQPSLRLLDEDGETILRLPPE